MPNKHSLFLFEHKFDEFLFTPIGEEENGMVLNVMSAFARRNVDPWEEAANKMSDMGAGEWQKMLCAEAANIMANAVDLAPAKSHTLTVTMSVAPL